jgi:hypothetical protein
VRATRAGDSFVFCSVGAGYEDGAAKHDHEWENGDYVFWPVQE